MANKTKGKDITILAVIGVLLVALIVVGIGAVSRLGKTDSQITKESAVTQLQKKLKKIDVEVVPPRKATVEISGGNLAEELPNIEQYPLSVQGHGDINIEIFSSTEKASGGTDGWLNEVAEAFNNEHHQINGQWVTVSVRPIASGAAVDYIVSGKYVPEVYTPSNTLWGEMIAAKNVDIRMVKERIAGNCAGILVNDDTYKKLKETYGEVNSSTIIEATIKSEISMGYTNPYSSSTGMNFLLNALHAFDANDILSDQAVEQFQKFQANVPFVAYSTLQMRDAADSGVLDAFILESQGYYNATELRDYEFVPFGVRHDNPVYAIGNLTADEDALLTMFVDYCLTEQNQRLAKEYGFNQMEEYTGVVLEGISGDTMLSAQKLWKKEKDAGNPVMAVFVADVSGSMGGVPLQELQASLINASQYINDTNYVGLVSYSTDVAINLPIAQFDLNQRSYFTGAVQDLSPGGNTATYDAVLVALDMLMKSQESVEAESGQKVKPLLFVLSDGETNIGNKLSDIRDVVEGLEVPCYTIGYNANLDALAELSAINEAASINADSDDVIYNLKSLFNAQM
ncbi:MAG: VWA domain-containing protein [Oscillospiraceae bacterium]|nr:VWA domain-containing protein [Oscillospiraceae bacterium]